MFFFVYGLVKKPHYNQNLAITELIVLTVVLSIEQHIVENRTRNFASLKLVPCCIRAHYDKVSLYFQIIGSSFSQTKQ